MTQSILEAVLTCLLASLALLAEHYIPWHLEKPWTYVAGSVGMLGPVVGVYLYWAYFPPPGNPFWWAIGTLLVDVTVSGVTIIGCYHADKYNLLKLKADEAKVWRDE